MKLYTVGCPKCHVLEKKLQAKGIDFEIVDDKSIMEREGITSLPVLELEDGKRLSFSEAVQYVNSK